MESSSFHPSSVALHLQQIRIFWVPQCISGPGSEPVPDSPVVPQFVLQPTLIKHPGAITHLNKTSHSSLPLPFKGLVLSLSLETDILCCIAALAAQGSVSWWIWLSDGCLEAPVLCLLCQHWLIPSLEGALGPVLPSCLARQVQRAGLEGCQPWLHSTNPALGPYQGCCIAPTVSLWELGICLFV